MPIPWYLLPYRGPNRNTPPPHPAHHHLKGERRNYISRQRSSLAHSVDVCLWQALEAMQSIKEVVSPYQGSEKTYEMVKEQIAERWGEEVAEDFDPYTDAMPLVSWAAYGYRVKKGQKALKSVTFVEVKNDKGEVERKIKRTVNLFHKRQVEKAA